MKWHVAISFEMPVGHLNKTGLEIPFLCPLGITFEMPAGHYFLTGFACCRDEMPVGHHFLKKAKLA